MEKVFETILRWLQLDDEYEVKANNIVIKHLPKNMFFILFERVRDNITLNSFIVDLSQDEIVIDRREYVDNFWCKCRLTIKDTPDEVLLTYKFLGYEALVNNSVVLVDSVKSMMELGD